MTRTRLSAAWLAQARPAAQLDSATKPSPASEGRSNKARLPGYEPSTHGVGIVHLGVGNFHKAHQAIYTDDVLARYGGDWRILGVSLRGEDAANALNPQDGLYTLLVRDPGGTQARVVGSIAGVVAASRDPALLWTALTNEGTRIVTLTVTEKAYGIDRATGRVQQEHPAIAHDLLHPGRPAGAVGILVWGLLRRRELGIAPFTVLCCDNLPENGRLLQAGVCDMADRIEPGMGKWISAHVAFPSSMVDRITPTATDKTLEDAAQALGCEDYAAVETEPFTMWVIEDHFPSGRPAWENVGALMVDDVTPYEHMKLRMLNGAHSLLAYAGFVAGHIYVRDAMQDATVARRVREYLQHASTTLQALPGVDFDDYAAALCQRFANTAIAHKTYQIAMDGTEKLPQRILSAAQECLTSQRDTHVFAFATAAWMRYCLGVTDAGTFYDLRDPRAHEITAAVHNALRKAGSSVESDKTRKILGSNLQDVHALSAALMALPGLFSPALQHSSDWGDQIDRYLQIMLSQGMKAALQVGHF
ncbi:MAG: mannitol dehydrogenase family protein [Paralcaligenes sp.]